jgi:PAS domain S-box-containing protein
MSSVDAGGQAQGKSPVTTEELTEALSASPDPFSIFRAVRGADGQVTELLFTFLNDAAARLYGRPVEAVLGHGVCELFPSVRERGIWDTYLEVIDSGTPKSFEVPWFQENALGGFFRLTAGPFRDGLLVSAVDITEQRRAEKELAETSRRYKLLAENASDYVVEASLDDVITWVSPSVTAVLGWQPEQIVGRSWFDFAHPDDLEALQDLDARVAAGEQVSDKVRVRCADGSYRWMSRRWHTVTDRSGTVVARVAGMRDVQAEVDAQQALAESEKRYRLLAENASDVVVLTDPDGRITWVSPAVTGRLGWASEDLLGTRLLELVHPDDAVATADARARVYSGEEVTAPPGGFLMRFRTKSGAYVWMSGLATPVMDESGAPVGVVSGLRNVDELVQAREEAQADRTAIRATVDSLLDPHILLEAVRDETGQIVDFVYVDANPAACAYNRMDYEDLVGARLLDLLPGHATAGLLEQYRQVVETGEPLVQDDIVYAQELLGGVERHYDARAARVGDGLSYTWRDVTDRYEAAQRLAESEEHYRLLAENASDVVMRLSPSWRYEWVSGSVVGLLGWQPPDLVGRLIDEFIHPDDLAQFRQGADTAPGSATSLEFRFRRPDDTYRWVVCRTRLKVDQGGAPEAVVGGLVDIADRKAAESKELDRLRELEKFQRITVGRELRMIELKKEIEYLRKPGSAKVSDTETSAETDLS